MQLRIKEPGLTTDDWPQNEAEFETLFEARFEEVYRLLFRITSSTADAEDLAQETFLRLHDRVFGRGGRKPEADPPLGPWLCRVALNLGYNSVRDRRRLVRRHRWAGARGAVAEAVPPPDEGLAREEERARARQALRELPSRQSRILLLRHSGLSYQEISEVLEVSPGSVGTLLSRAQAAFLKAYQSPPTPGGSGSTVTPTGGAS
jgi:RNA polymerase sigma-70 factor (ECF subfamily)